MAVTVYDRNGEAWAFDHGTGASVDPDTPGTPLWILDKNGICIGGFNSQAWTHFEIKTENPALPAITDSLTTLVCNMTGGGGGGSGAAVAGSWIKKK
ncbi:hypothetical protein SEA_STLSCUM_5 [Mycobacterium phage STLscum]|nr:hypothetical protein SEA_STLSCUM_5 [Mycobacterium phage STLscum]UVK64135.1 hypothetical protein SEA_NORZ_4 [Mycobacterium phage Norz]